MTDLSKIIVDTTVQPKAVAFPTEAKLKHRARERLVHASPRSMACGYAKAMRGSAKARADPASALRPRQAVQARQSRTAAGSRADARPGDPRHQTQDRRRRRRFRRSSGKPLALARRVLRAGGRGQREAESLQPARARGRMHRHSGKPHRPYEFGVKVSVATTLGHAKGKASFVAPCQSAARQSLRRPHAGDDSFQDMERRVGARRSDAILADAGYRGHNAPPRIQVQGLYCRAEARRGPIAHPGRTAPPASHVEPVIGFTSKKITAWAATTSPCCRPATPPTPCSAAAGYNFRRLIRWLAF